MPKLADLNGADDARATALLTPLIERAPQIARRAARQRPFRTIDELANAIRRALLELSESERIDLFRAHPELAPDNPLTMTRESQSEQGRLRLTSGDGAFRARLAALNARYREKFGFPFITALVRHPNIDSVLAEFEKRLECDREHEIEEAIDQIAAVSASRVRLSFGESETRTTEIGAAST